MLGVGSGSHAEQAARVIERLEPVLRDESPDLVVVPGDVNSTLAAALCAAAWGPLAHVESGLRSFDREMPEEINRIVVDHLSELLLPPLGRGDRQSRRRGLPDGRIFVGNTMIDTLAALEDRFRRAEAAAALGLEQGAYLLVTLHRPALVDGPLLEDAMSALAAVARSCRCSFRSTPAPEGRARARAGFAGWSQPSASRPATSTSSRWRPTRLPCSRIPAGSRKRRRGWAFPASPFATTPSAP